MTDPHHDPSLFFRFLNLDKLQAFTLTKEVAGASYTPHPENKGYIGCVPLLECHLDNLNIFYVRQQIKLSDCDILIAATTHNTSGTFAIPQIVNKWLKHIDCQLTFSFTLREDD